MPTPLPKTLATLCNADGWSPDILDSLESRYAAAFLAQFAFVGGQGIVFQKSRITLDEDITTLLPPTVAGITNCLFTGGLKRLAALGLITLDENAVVVREEFAELIQVQVLQHETRSGV